MKMIRILYIEDDLTTAKYLNAFLSEHCFDVVHTDSVVSAHSYINTETFDLILLDLNMPDYSGFDLLKTVNALTLPVIVISAFSDTATKVKAFRYGACDYLVASEPLRQNDTTCTNRCLATDISGRSASAS